MIVIVTTLNQLIWLYLSVLGKIAVPRPSTGTGEELTLGAKRQSARTSGKCEGREAMGIKIAPSEETASEAAVCSNS
jgi:hypothetical protein